MRVLLSTCGTRGDVEPVMALAVRLRALGVEVRMCAPPDYVERLAEVGVPMVAVGQPVYGRTPGLAAEVIAEQFDKVPAAAEGCDAVVAAGTLAIAVGVRSVAEKLGIPYVYAAYSPFQLRSPYDPSPRPRGDGEPPAPDMTDPQVLRDLRDEGLYSRFGGPVNSQRAAIGLPPVENIVDYACTDRPWLAADPNLAPLRPGQDAVQTGAWILPDERPLAAELEAFLEAGPPPVYVGFGSTPETVDAARVAIAAIRAQGRRVVLSRGWADLALPDDGAECFAVGEANLQVLFGRVAAVVHHGGAGTTHVAAQAGAPQIVIPRGMDQPYFAERVAELGVGVAHVGAAHDGPIPTVGSMSGALATALAPETRARATAVAGTMRTDGTTVAAELLLDAVSREKAIVSA